MKENHSVIQAKDDKRGNKHEGSRRSGGTDEELMKNGLGPKRMGWKRRKHEVA